MDTFGIAENAFEELITHLTQGYAKIRKKN